LYVEVVVRDEHGEQEKKFSTAIYAYTQIFQLRRLLYLPSVSDDFEAAVLLLLWHIIEGRGSLLDFLHALHEDATQLLLGGLLRLVVLQLVLAENVPSLLPCAQTSSLALEIAFVEGKLLG